MVKNSICSTAVGLTIAALTPSVLHAQAKIDFAVFEGPIDIRKGDGGTKITKNGIDYWTSGTPPRRYQIIGRISDRRSEEWDGGHAVGSPSIARKVLKAGGNAVILLDQQDVGTGGGGFGNLSGGWGSFFSVGTSKTTTVFVVVKYLDELPNADPTGHP